MNSRGFYGFYPAALKKNSIEYEFFAWLSQGLLTDACFW
jgi:hypothetical protein